MTNAENRLQAEAKLVELKKAVAAGLRAAGLTVEADETTGNIKSIDGVGYGLVEFSCEAPGYRYNGKVYASVGGYGHKTRFPEGKNGVSVEKVVDAIVQLIGQKARNAQAEQELANRVAAAKDMALRINIGAGVEAHRPLADERPYFRGVHAEANSYGGLTVELPKNLTVEQASAFVELARKLGL